MIRVRRIDLNCDLGEAATPEQREVEAHLIQYVTSVNIACGVHAGDAELMRHTIQLARQYDLAIGAHPGLPDRESCGRRELPLSQAFVLDVILSQVSELLAIGQAEGIRLSHVKPHGALYNMAARDPELADAVAAGIAQINSRLILIGLAGSALLGAGTAHGLRVAAEGFADRAYQADGRLVPRTEAHALIHDESTVVARAHALVQEGTITTVDGAVLRLHIDTLCMHADTPGAVRLAHALRTSLADAGVSIRRLDHAD